TKPTRPTTRTSRPPDHALLLPRPVVASPPTTGRALAGFGSLGPFGTLVQASPRQPGCGRDAPNGVCVPQSLRPEPADLRPRGIDRHSIGCSRLADGRHAALDHDDELAALGNVPPRQGVAKLGERTTTYLLVELGQLPADRRSPLPTARVRQVPHRGLDAAGRLEKDGCPLVSGDPAQAVAALATRAWQEALERPARADPTRDDRGEQ